ncbi:UNVERIFIED_ORG: hypothetical protein BDK47_1541, partial [Anoxybacillus amylolyticus]
FLLSFLAICSVSKLITGYTELTGFYGFSQKKKTSWHPSSNDVPLAALPAVV